MPRGRPKFCCGCTKRSAVSDAACVRQDGEPRAQAMRGAHPDAAAAALRARAGVGGGAKNSGGPRVVGSLVAGAAAPPNRARIRKVDSPVS